MIEAIGLIVAVYAATRLLQVPFEHAAYQMEWLGMSFDSRSALVCFFSIVGIIALALLTGSLLESGESIRETIR